MLKCESTRRCFQQGEGPSRGLFRDYEPFLTNVTGSSILSYFRYSNSGDAMYRKWTASGRKSVSNYEDDGVGANIKIDSGGGTRDWAARAWEHGEYLSFKRGFGKIS